MKRSPFRATVGTASTLLEYGETRGELVDPVTASATR